ncbi:MAG: dehydrogenase E1 component subunit alpha/beta [Rhodothermales bacterium]|nr:dehydrogenase E1 component subunit alpha/beta [Rhodothermales bacterium]MDG2016195.1 dehydrogenase E1 component subunit alpha/beta [Rhodothermales bacterium]HAY37543.1 tungsten formylmethanofuran dehydrogenase [Bacteroidota bacterium]
MARASKSVKKATATAGDGASVNVEMTTSTSGRKLFESDFDVKPVGVSDFDPSDLLSIYQKMLTSRRLDEKMLTLLKQGKGFFHIGCAGHEAAQAAVGFLSRPGEDWYSLYYRDMMMYLMLGGTKEEILLHHLAKADDPNSGGRQMAEHFGNRSRNILPISSSVGAQFLPAVGVALALQREKKEAYVYCSCGDGATSQGDFHEALNWAARESAPVLFIVQDNGYAISVPVRDQTAGGSAFKLAKGYEGLARIHVDGTNFFETYAAAQAAIEHIKAGKGPVCLVADLVRLLPHSSSDNHAKYRSPEELEADKREDPILQLEKELLNAGLLKDADIVRLRKEVQVAVDEATVWADAQADPDPETALLHVLSEEDSGLEFESTEPSGEPIVVVDAINHALHEEMERNEKVIVYGEDVAGGKGGVFTATRELTAKFGKERCFNSPLAEASIIGTAVGFASAGFKPVVEIQFGDYIWPAMQALRNQVASYRYRSNGDWACPMVIRVPVGGYIHGGLCHSQNIESIFAHMPGFQIAMPSTAADAKGLLKAAIRMDDPVIFMEHKALYRSAAARSPEPDSEYLLPFGKARTVREGTDLTIVTYGMMVHKSVNAARQLEKEGLSVEIIDLRTLLPIDMDTVLASVRKTSRALVVYEDHEFLGYGAELAAQIADIAFFELDAPVKRLAGKFAQIAFADPLERALLPQDEDILDAVRNLASL